MVRVDLKGIAKVTSKGRSYYYAWRGGSRLTGEPGSPEFTKSYYNAILDRNAPDQTRFLSVVTSYKASRDYEGLADSTRRNWSPWLDRISDHFGNLSISQFDRPQKIRPIIRRWRNQYADRPRTADYGMQVLSRVLSYAVDPLAVFAGNPCEGIKQLYSGDRSEIIWTEADLQRIKRASNAEAANIIDLACYTGLRRSDLIELCWSHVGDDAIIKKTRKSKYRVEAIIPIYDDLRVVLDRIPRRATTVLTNTYGRPWSEDGFDSAIKRAKEGAGITKDDNLHFNDLRGTAITRMYVADLPIRVIAEIVGWEEASVEKIIRRYVGRAAATRATIHRLKQAKRRT